MPGIQIISSECAKACISTCAVKCACQPAAPAPKPLCHDVSLLLAEINTLSYPKLSFSSISHAPSVPCPCEPKGVPLPFGYDSRLVRDELHHPLLCYLAEGVAPAYFGAGVPHSRIVTAREIAPHDKLDGYRSLQSFVYGTLLLSLNAALLQDAPRNSCIDGKRLWAVAGPCGSALSSLELRVGGTPSVVLDLHPSTVVSNALMDAVLAAVKIGAAYDTCRGRVISEKTADSCLHFDALTLLTQIWTRFARDLHRKGASVSWIVLSNLERSIVFHRGSAQISVSHVINGDGVSTPRDAVQNLYSLLLAVSVLEKHQYSHPALVDLL